MTHDNSEKDENNNMIAKTSTIGIQNHKYYRDIRRTISIIVIGLTTSIILIRSRPVTRRHKTSKKYSFYTDSNELFPFLFDFAFDPCVKREQNTEIIYINNEHPAQQQESV